MPLVLLELVSSSPCFCEMLVSSEPDILGHVEQFQRSEQPIGTNFTHLEVSHYMHVLDR